MYRNCLAIATLFLFLVPFLEADVISLNNGDRFSGQVKSLDGGKLVVATDYAGEISVDWSVVESFSLTENLQVGLESGDTVSGKIELTGGDQLQVTTETETLALNRGQIIEFGPIPQPEDYGLLDNWHGGLNLGVSLSKGNTDVSNLSFSADPSRATSRDRISLFFSTLRSAEDGRTTGNLSKLSGRYDRFLTDNFFTYGNGVYDKDEKATLDYRYREGGGFGYQFKKGDHTDLSLRGGVAALQEKFAGRDRSTSGLGNIGLDLRSAWLAPFAVTASTNYSPFLQGDSRYLLEGLLGIRLPLFGSLNFGLDFVDNYYSSPPGGTKNNDLRILSTLGWAF